MRLYIVSGISGAGKSIVLNALEDLGFYCIDNLPIALLPAFAREMQDSEQPHYRQAAVGIDARNLANELPTFPNMLKALTGDGTDSQVLFLDANDATLLKRFSETRRRHPLTGPDVPLAEAIRRERALLEPISSRADLRIDTSCTNVHQLRDLIRERVGAPAEDTGMSILFQSFGYKHGIPIDSDFVFDVRCLPNPHWDPQLRALTGRDPEVATFLEQQSGVERMFRDLCGFLEHWIPAFEQDSRSYMTIAVGCTGGQHRSVYFVQRLTEHFAVRHFKVLTRHRELS